MPTWDIARVATPSARWELAGLTAQSTASTNRWQLSKLQAVSTAPAGSITITTPSPVLEPGVATAVTVQVESLYSVVIQSFAQQGGSQLTISSSGNTAQVTGPARLIDVDYTVRFTATDNTGVTAYKDFTIRVLAVTERAVIGGVEVPMLIR